MSDKEKLDAIIAEKQDSLPFDEELDKAALKFYLNCIQTNKFSIDSTGTVLPREMAKFGAEWQKQQMIEEAIPAFIGTNRYGNKYIQGWAGLNQYDEFDNGDEVKIIIVKG